MATKYTDILDPKQEQVMVDIETLGVGFNSVPVSIGATKFTIEDGITDKFIVNIDPFDARNHGLVIDSDTVAWWKTQPVEARDAWRVDPKPLKEALQKFSAWFGKSKPVWAKGTDFDSVILKTAFAAAELATPWKYYEVTDMRTVLKLIPVEYEGELVPHISLNDAIMQTEHLLKVLRS